MGKGKVIIYIFIIFLCLSSSCNAEYAYKYDTLLSKRIYQEEEGSNKEFICRSLCSDGTSKLFILSGAIGEDIYIDSFDVYHDIFSRVLSFQMPPFDELESYWETVKNTNDQSVNDLIAVNGTNLICYNAIKHSICIYNIKTNKWINEIKIEIDDYIDPSSYVYPIEDYEIWESLMDLVMIKNKVFFYLDIPTSDGRWEAALFCTDIITESTRKIEGISRVASRVFSLDDTYFYVCIENKYYVWLLEDMHFIDMIELNVDLSNCDIVNMGGRVVAINDKSGDVYEIKKDKDGSLCCSDVIFKIQMDNVQALCGISDTLLAVYYDDLEEELAYIEIKEFSDKETKETGTVRDR